VADPQAMDDEQLRARIREIRSEEEAVSYERRMLHGRIDVLRSEILARISGQSADGASASEAASQASLLDRLTDVLSHKGPPPVDEELDRLGADDHGTSISGDLDELPDLTALSDDDLAAYVHTLSRRERIVSDRRQVLHQEIEGLRAENVARLRRRYAGADSEAGGPAVL
jgi:hypothetical protein